MRTLEKKWTDFLLDANDIFTIFRNHRVFIQNNYDKYKVMLAQHLKFLRESELIRFSTFL